MVGVLCLWRCAKCGWLLSVLPVSAGRGVAGGAVAGCERVLVVLGCSRCGHSTGTPAAVLPLLLLLPPFCHRRHARPLVAVPQALAASGAGRLCRQHLLLVSPVLAARAASAHEQLAACAKGHQRLLLVRGWPLPVPGHLLFVARRLWMQLRPPLHMQHCPLLHGHHCAHSCACHCAPAPALWCPCACWPSSRLR